MMKRAFASLLPTLLLFVVSAAAQKPPATGEAIQVHPEAKAAIDGIWSPYCPGLMLEVCTSSGGAMLRDSIQRMALDGLDHEAIVEVIISDYGEEWRAEPKVTGTGLWAWLLPPGALVAGLGLVGVVLARRRQEERPVAAGDVDPEAEARIRAALKVLDEEEEPVF